MRALVCSEFGPLDLLSVEEVADPVPEAGEVVVQVEAAGVNFPDLLMVQGRYQARPAVPFIPGAEAAGVVVETGPGVEDFQVGDRVIGLGLVGAFAEKWKVAGASLLPRPAGLSASEAAGFGLAFGTAYHALVDRAQLQPGETLLVLGAAGGVGSAAVEVGSALGARVIAAASSPGKLEFCRALGAADTIDYTGEDLKERVRELTGGVGVDVVFDPVGGELSEASLRATAWGARFLVIGFADGQIPSLPLNLPLLMERSIIGVYWGAWVERHPSASGRNFEALGTMVADGKVRPRVSGEFGLDDHGEAFATLTERRALGKVVLIP